MTAVGVDLEKVETVLGTPEIGLLTFRAGIGLGLGAGKQDGLAVKGEFRREKRATLQLLSGEAAVLDPTILQKIDEAGSRAERILEHEQSAAGNGIAAVELVAHVEGALGVVTLEE